MFVAKYNIVLLAEHVPGVENGAADALSHDNVLSFFALVQGARVCIGAIGGSLCPVKALTEYLNARGHADGPLYHYESGIPLSRWSSSAYTTYVRTPASDLASWSQVLAEGH